MYALEFLGGASIQGAKGAVAGPATQRHRIALLALLATARAASRDKLCAYLWPERDSENARKLLNQAVHALRRALGREAILSAGDELRLGTSVVRCDVVAFEAALAAAEFERAVDLYSGPFLDGFHLGSAPEFEQWTEGERQRLAGAYAGALERLARAAEARDDAASAVDWWKARAAHDPYDSRVALQLMRAHVAAGNPAGALQHAAIHARLLSEELGTEPGPEFLALAERLRDDPATTVDWGRDRGNAEPGIEVVSRAGAPGPELASPMQLASGTGVAPPAGPAAGSAAPDGPAEPGRAAPAQTVHEPRRDRRAARFALPAGLIALAILAGALWVGSTRAPMLHPERVVVAAFENRTGDPALDPIGPMAADLIRQGLLHTGLVEVASGTAQTAMAANAPSEPVRALAEETGAGLVVSGAYYLAGDSLRFQAQLTDARRRRVLTALAASEAALADPIPAIETLRQHTLGALALVIDGNLWRHAQQSIPLPTYEAYRAYMDALDIFLDRRWAESIEYLERAAALDSTYPSPRILTAVAHMNLGAMEEAGSVLRALDRSKDRWGAYDRAYLAMLMTWLGEDQAARYEATKRLAAMSNWAVPQLGVEAVGLNRPREAIEILGRVDPARAEFARRRAWYWISLADAHHMLGDHRRELRVARRARSLVPDDPAHLFLEARALAALGRLAAVEAAVDARSSYSGQRDPDAGALMVAVGHELRVHGHPAAARAMYFRAASWYRERVADEQPRYRTDLARALLFAGEQDAARALFEQLAEEEPDHIDHQGALGMLAAQAGDRPEAERIAGWMAARTGPDLRTSPGLWINSHPTYWRACIAAQLGREAEAVSLLSQALGQAVPHGRHPHTDPCLDPLRDYPPFRELMRPKG
jgi:DNA-binding SARP family transcriptional activator/TolB-like protein